MTLQNYLQSYQQQLDQEATEEQKQDRQTAKQEMPRLLTFIEKNCPKLWQTHQENALFNGSTLVKKDPNVGGNGHNTPALIVEGRYLLYCYRNSAYWQITISRYRGEFVRVEKEETVYAELSNNPELNDRRVAQMFQQLEK